MIRRLRVLAILGIFAVLAPPAYPAGPDNKVARVGSLYPRSEPWGNHFYEGLRDEGFFVGENVVVTVRETGTDLARAGPLADALISQGVDVLVAQPGRVAQGAKEAVQRAGKAVPIVFMSYDPLQEGFVTSLSHPDRNMTGVNEKVSTEIYTKQLELLLELVPSASRIALLRDPTSTPAAFDSVKGHLEKATAARGVRLIVAEIKSQEAIASVLASLKRDKIDALIVPPMAFAVTHRRSLIDTVARLRLPAIWGYDLFVRDGALIGYWSSMDDTQRTVGRMVGMLLKGKPASQIPVEQPRRFKLAINATTANSLSLMLPPSLLARADEVVR